MTTQQFRLTPLSDRVTKSLISAAQAYAEMITLVKEYPENKRILSDMLLALDSYYNHYSMSPSIDDICQMIYITDESSGVGRFIAAVSQCMEYAYNRISKTEVLTAGDILFINNAIRTEPIKVEKPLTRYKMEVRPPLSGEVSDNNEQIIECLWEILHDLYAPKQQYSFILEMAIAAYRMLTLLGMHISLQTFTILFSVVCRNELAMYGLVRQWTLFTDPIVSVSSMDTESALSHILDIFQGVWEYTSSLMRIINKRKTEISRLLSVELHQHASVGQLLMESICVTKRDVIRNLHISPNTAKKYLTQLEKRDILRPVKNWREIAYFNNLMIATIKEQL